MTITPSQPYTDFKLYPSDRQLAIVYRDGTWGEIIDASDAIASEAISPTTATFSYGFSIFEGFKAERHADRSINVFRLSDHAARFNLSSDRMALPPLPLKRFIDGTKQLIEANNACVPEHGEGQFYIRPLMVASEPMLGLRRSKRAICFFYGSPVGMYGGESLRSNGIKLKGLNISRAVPGGTGTAKSGVNYGGTIVHKEQAIAEGYHDVLFCAAPNGIQETMGTNVFCIFQDTAAGNIQSLRIVTPRTNNGLILKGITRQSAIDLIDHNIGSTVPTQSNKIVPLSQILTNATFSEADIQFDDILSDNCIEMFCTGTASGIRNVTQLAAPSGREKHFTDPLLAPTLYSAFRQIQTGQAPDSLGWLTRL